MDTVILDFIAVGSGERLSQICNRATFYDDIANMEVFTVAESSFPNGIVMKNTGYIAVYTEGIPFIWDNDLRRAVVELSEITCRLDGVPYRGKSGRLLMQGVRLSMEGANRPLLAANGC